MYRTWYVFMVALKVKKPSSAPHTEHTRGTRRASITAHGTQRARATQRRSYSSDRLSERLEFRHVCVPGMYVVYWYVLVVALK